MVGKLPFNLRAPSDDLARIDGLWSAQKRRPPFLEASVYSAQRELLVA